jgi:feruloyl esterase
MKTRIFGALCALTLTAFFGVTAANAANGSQPCDSLSSLKLPDTTITSATAVPAGPWAPPAAAGAQNAPRPVDLPAFCRVQLTVAPAIKIEVWMPATGWNGNFEGVGGGGFAGVIAYPALANALKEGYATASTDTGHEGNNAEFALGHPDLLVDFGYRAIHEMTVKAKALVEKFYSAPPRLSFFNGCSTGGRQGLTEAQRFPEDYNGIIAGAPANDWSHLQTRGLLVGIATLQDEDSYIPRTKLAAIQNASVAACDTIDGVKDGLVDDPRKCNFDPSVLLCKGADSDSCLNAKQVEALKKVYAAAKYPDGKVAYPAYEPGTESGWGNFTTGAGPGKAVLLGYGVGYMKFFVLGNSDWDYHTWDAAKYMPLVDNGVNRAAYDSSSTDLKAFRDHGGKLISYQGWGDDAVSPLHTIGYFKGVVASVTGVGKGSTDALAPETPEINKAMEQSGSFYRLFMVPGMNHCGGGTGPNVFDGFNALVNWVDKKQAPDQIVATHMTNGAPDRTRPLCPYPQTAQYSGSGSIDDAANFACKMPAKAK